MQLRKNILIYVILAATVILAIVYLEENLYVFTASLGMSVSSHSRSPKVRIDGANINPTLTTQQDELNILRMDGVTQNLSHLNLEILTAEQLLLTLHSYLDNANVICKRKLRMGALGDGGWEVCDDPEVRPEPPCIIYSFGFGKNFTFDEDMAKWYKCHVYNFDPVTFEENHNRKQTVLAVSFDTVQDLLVLASNHDTWRAMTSAPCAAYGKKGPKSSQVYFYQLGIGALNYTNNQGMQFSTLSDIRQNLGHSRISIVKMDVEGDEWLALHHMAVTKELQKIDQLLIAFHIFSEKHFDLVRYARALQVVEMAGFRIFYTHKNEGCGKHVIDFPPITSTCFEVHYLRQ